MTRAQRAVLETLAKTGSWAIATRGHMRGIMQVRRALEDKGYIVYGKGQYEITDDGRAALRAMRSGIHALVTPKPRAVTPKCKVCGHALHKHGVYVEFPDRIVCHADHCTRWTDCWKKHTASELPAKKSSHGPGR